jgi:hypothetical protein
MPAWMAVVLLLALALACLLAVVSGWSRYRTGCQNTTIIEDRPRPRPTTTTRLGHGYPPGSEIAGRRFRSDPRFAWIER